MTIDVNTIDQRQVAAPRAVEITRTLILDVETRSKADLKAVGAHHYAADETTEVLCAAFAVDDEPIQLWKHGDPVPAEIHEFARNDNMVVVAHNASFERCIARHVLTPRHGWPEIPIEKWRCTMARAYAHALPGALENVVKALGLPYEKDKAGQRLMLRMCKPKPDGSWHEDPESLEALYRYCCSDVEAERSLFRALPALTADEQEIWRIDQLGG
jgi:DNA polymerase bacteriophage-type